MRAIKLLFVLYLSLFLFACGGTNDAGDGNNGGDNKTEENNKTAEEKILGAGDTAEIDNVKITLKNVSLTDERNEFADTDPNQVVKIEYELENNTDDEIPVGGGLEVYDKTGNKAETYPLENTLGSLQPGKKMQCTDHFGIEKGPIEIYFQPMFSFEDPVIFQADVK